MNTATIDAGVTWRGGQAPRDCDCVAFSPLNRQRLSLNHKKEAVTLRSEEHSKEMIREGAALMWGLESLCSEGREEGLWCEVKGGEPGAMTHAKACEHLPGSCRGPQTSSRAPSALVQKFPEESPVRPS